MTVYGIRTPLTSWKNVAFGSIISIRECLSLFFSALETIIIRNGGLKNILAYLRDVVTSVKGLQSTQKKRKGREFILLFLISRKF